MKVSSRRTDYQVFKSPKIFPKFDFKHFLYCCRFNFQNKIFNLHEGWISIEDIFEDLMWKLILSIYSTPCSAEKKQKLLLRSRVFFIISFYIFTYVRAFWRKTWLISRQSESVFCKFRLDLTHDFWLFWFPMRDRPG